MGDLGPEFPRRAADGHPDLEKTLVKRFTLLRHRAMEAVSKPELLEEHRYSLSCIPLTPWSRCSGVGHDRGWLVWINCMPDDERRVPSSFEASGVRLAARESMAVDPDSPDEDEQIMMSFPQQTHHVSAWEHELLMEGEEPENRPSPSNGLEDVRAGQALFTASQRV